MLLQPASYGGTSLLAILLHFIAMMLTLPGCAQTGNGAATFIQNLQAGKKQTVVTYGTSLTASSIWPAEVQLALNGKYPGLLTVKNGAQSAKASN